MKLVTSLVWLMLVASAGPLRANTIVSFGGLIQASQYNLTGIEVAMSFIATANETVTGASIVGSGGYIEAEIEDFSNGAPSNTALSGGTATANLVNPAVYTNLSALDVNLVQGTAYWIVLSTSNGASINLSSTAAGTVPNVSGDYTLNNGANWSTEGSGSGYYYPNLTLTGTVTSVPESPTFWLAIGAVLLLSGLTVRQRKSQNGDKL